MAVETWGDEREEIINARDALFVELTISETRRQKAESQRDDLLAALEAVEWVLVKHWDGYTRECPWCHADWTNSEGEPPPHRSDCHRQAAITRAKGDQ